MNPGEAKSSDRARLAGIARQAMIERGLEPDFPPAAQQQLTTIGGPAAATNDARDMRDRLWASIDNDDSRKDVGSYLCILHFRVDWVAE